MDQSPVFKIQFPWYRLLLLLFCNSWWLYSTWIIIHGVILPPVLLLSTQNCFQYSSHFLHSSCSVHVWPATEVYSGANPVTYTWICAGCTRWGWRSVITPGTCMRTYLHVGVPAWRQRERCLNSQDHRFSNGLRRLLWEGCSTPKGVVTQRLKTAEQPLFS